MAVIQGSPGNDLLVGGSDPDTITGAAGNDTIYGGGGNNLIYGNQDIDVILSLTQGQSVAAQASDTIYGGQGNDIVVAAFSPGDPNGFDRLIYGNLGDDILLASINRDTVFGGQGNDIILGFDGNDLIYGNLGDDVIVSGSEGSSTGNDTVYGGRGRDTIDYSSASGNHELIYGNFDNDIIVGSAKAGAVDGNDTIYGGQGNDIIRGNSGADELLGNLGDDTFSYVIAGESSFSNLGVGIDTIWDFSSGHDALDFTTPGTAGGFVRVTGTTNNDFTNAKAVADITIAAGGSPQYVFIQNASGDGGFLFADENNTGVFAANSTDDAIFFATGTVIGTDIV